MNYTIEELEQDGNKYLIGKVEGTKIVAPVLLDEYTDKIIARRKIEASLDRAINYYKKFGEWAHEKVKRKEVETTLQHKARVIKEENKATK